jgi:hypothetical protein
LTGDSLTALAMTGLLCIPDPVTRADPDGALAEAQLLEV